jgi:hypothetical protein
MSLRDNMIDWVNEHTEEDVDGWRAADPDGVRLTDQLFPTEGACCEWLWDYITANPDILEPLP